MNFGEAPYALEAPAHSLGGPFSGGEVSQAAFRAGKSLCAHAGHGKDYSLRAPRNERGRQLEAALIRGFGTVLPCAVSFALGAKGFIFALWTHG